MEKLEKRKVSKYKGSRYLAEDQLTEGQFITSINTLIEELSADVKDRDSLTYGFQSDYDSDELEIYCYESRLETNEEFDARVRQDAQHQLNRVEARRRQYLELKKEFDGQ